MTQTAAPTNSDSTSLFGYRQWTLLTLAAASAVILFLLVGHWFNIPTSPGYEPSAFMQQGAILHLIVLGLLLSVCVIVGTAIARSARQDAGLLAACVGLCAMATRFGEIHFAYREAEGRGIFIRLAVETGVWFLFVASAWMVQNWLHVVGFVRRDYDHDRMEDPEHPIGINVFATATHVAAMCLGMLLLARSGDKVQALAAVGLSSFLATLIAHWLFNVTPSIWMWISPMIVGMLGYLLAYGQSGEQPDWIIGNIAQPMARVAPIDYAAAGPVGALLGYWVSRKWNAARQREQTASRKANVTIIPPRRPVQR